MRQCQILVSLSFPTYGREFPLYLALKNATRILLFHQSEASQKASKIALEILKLRARKSKRSFYTFALHPSSSWEVTRRRHDHNALWLVIRCKGITTTEGRTATLLIYSPRVVPKGQFLRVLGTNPSIHLDAVEAKRKHSHDSPVRKKLLFSSYAIGSTESTIFQPRLEHVGSWRFVFVCSLGLIHH